MIAFIAAVFFGAWNLAYASDQIPLEAKHKSVISKITYKIPKGWVVTDGETDWLAPSDDKYFWQPAFNPDADTYYAVSVIPPFLTLDDRKKRRIRSLSEIVDSTMHSLRVAAGAKFLSPANAYQLEGRDAISIVADMNDGARFYQIFVEISDGEIATVAAQGPDSEADKFTSLVNSIAATIESGRN